MHSIFGSQHSTSSYSKRNPFASVSASRPVLTVTTKGLCVATTVPKLLPPMRSWSIGAPSSSAGSKTCKKDEPLSPREKWCSFNRISQKER